MSHRVKEVTAELRQCTQRDVVRERLYVCVRNVVHYVISISNYSNSLQSTQFIQSQYWLN